MKIIAIQAVLGLSFFGSVEAVEESNLEYGKCDIGVDKEIEFNEDINSLQDCESLCANTFGCKSYQWYDNGTPAVLQSQLWMYNGCPSPLKCVLYSEPVVEDLIHDTICYINDGGVIVEVGPDWCMVDENEGCGAACAVAVCADIDPDLEVVFAPPKFDVTLSTSPGCAFTEGTDNIGTITCTFDTKGAIDYTVDSALYSPDCSTAGSPMGVSLDTTTSSTGFNRALVGGGQYESAYVVTLPIANSAAAEGSTTIVFCLKTEVKDKNGDVYDWSEQKITKRIDVDGGFGMEIGIKGVSTDSLSTETLNGGEPTGRELEESSFKVGINRCDENGVEVSNGAALALGENFFLCVKGSQSIVVVSNIREMTAAKTGDTPSLSIVTEVGDGSVEGNLNSNTIVYGNGQNQVVIATRLPVPFFASSGVVTFSGSVNIVVGARCRISSSMQVDYAYSDQSENFSMDIQVAGMDDASSVSEFEKSFFEVGINRCDKNGVEVSNSAALAVGENFFLCVKGSQSQVVVSNIREMTAAKTGVTPSLSIVTEEGDGSGGGTSNSNTFVYGNGQNQVVIATRLPVPFFASSGTVTLSGSANIVVGANRQLSRSMQVASASSEESANFSMDIQVAGMDDASSASAIKTTAAMFFAAAVAALIV